MRSDNHLLVIPPFDQNANQLRLIPLDPKESASAHTVWIWSRCSIARRPRHLHTIEFHNESGYFGKALEVCMCQS
jgi:hypothetical protein